MLRLMEVYYDGQGESGYFFQSEDYFTVGILLRNKISLCLSFAYLVLSRSI